MAGVLDISLLCIYCCWWLLLQYFSKKKNSFPVIQKDFSPQLLYSNMRIAVETLLLALCCQ